MIAHLGAAPSSQLGRCEPVIPKSLSNIIVVLISLVWAANFFAQFVIHGYQPDSSINGVFGAVVGGALALSKKPSTNNKEAAK
jgi:hypothetical protein